MVNLGFVISGLGLIVFAVAMALVYRPPQPWKYRYLGACSSVVLIGLTIILRAYDAIPSIAGWGLVAFALLLFVILFYDIFFRRK